MISIEHQDIWSDADWIPNATPVSGGP